MEKKQIFTNEDYLEIEEFINAANEQNFEITKENTKEKITEKVNRNIITADFAINKLTTKVIRTMKASIAERKRALEMIKALKQLKQNQTMELQNLETVPLEKAFDLENEKTENVNRSWFEKRAKEETEVKLDKAKSNKIAKAVGIAVLAVALVAGGAVGGVKAYQNYAIEQQAKKDAEELAKKEAEQKALEEARRAADAAKETEETEYTSELENTIVNYSYEEITKLMESFKKECEQKGYDFKDKQITATVYLLNITHLNEEVTKELIDKGVIDEDFVDLFLNFVSVRNEINNKMVEYDALSMNQKAELTLEERNAYFIDITGAISDIDEESKAEAKVIFESTKKMYTTDSNETIKAEVNKFFNFFYSHDPRMEYDYNYEVTIKGKTKDFTYAETDTIVKKTVYLYWPNIAIKAGYMNIAQDIIDDAEYNISIITDFVKEAQYQGFNCNTNEISKTTESTKTSNSSNNKKTTGSNNKKVTGATNPAQGGYGVGTVINQTDTSTTTVVDEGPGTRTEVTEHNDYETVDNPITPAPNTPTEEIIPPEDDSEIIIINDDIVPDETDTYYEEADDVYCFEPQTSSYNQTENVYYEIEDQNYEEEVVEEQQAEDAKVLVKE